MSDTPRTDNEWAYYVQQDMQDAGQAFARGIELELQQANDYIKQLKQANGLLISERDRLNAELAELRKDKERLDWVQKHGQAEFTIAGHQGSYYSYEVDADTEDMTVRDAIDSAMESKP